MTPAGRGGVILKLRELIRAILDRKRARMSYEKLASRDPV